MGESVRIHPILFKALEEKENMQSLSNLYQNYNERSNADQLRDKCSQAKSSLFGKECVNDSVNTSQNIGILDQLCSPSPAKRITPRKPLRPFKSADHSDPSFQGVFIKVRSSVGKDTDSDNSPQLIIDSFFTCKRGQQERQERNHRKKIRKLKSSIELFPMDDSFSTTSTSFDTGNSSATSPIDFENDIGITPIQVDKICASCNTSRTPLWRDAEDGTHLCNACGIRWKKYRIRCLRCWYIPRKEEKNLPTCPSCCSQGTIRFTISKRHIF